MENENDNILNGKESKMDADRGCSMRSTLLGWFAIVIFSLFAAPSFAQDAGTAGGHGATGADQNFVTQLIRANDQEIDQAQAQLNAANGNAGITLFAKTMIADHTAANAQVAGIAAGLGLTYPKSHVATGSSNATGTKPMAAMTPQAYMVAQVAAHQQAIALLQGEIANGSSEQLKTLASQLLPTVKAHLAMAQQYVASGTVSPEVTPTPGQ
jgi:putative membrane protein